MKIDLTGRWNCEDEHELSFINLGGDCFRILKWNNEDNIDILVRRNENYLFIKSDVFEGLWEFIAEDEFRIHEKTYRRINKRPFSN